jgi:hypothetical protein
VEVGESAAGPACWILGRQKLRRKTGDASGTGRDRRPESTDGSGLPKASRIRRTVLRFRADVTLAAWDLLEVFLLVDFSGM